MEKQIEEMAEDIYNALPDYEHNFRDCRSAAEELTTKGYRKASEVAREIFAEIEELLNVQTKIACETRDKHKETFEPNLSFLAMLDGRIYSLRVVEEHITELKKKYESEGGE